jgi:hypothetical protein
MREQNRLPPICPRRFTKPLFVNECLILFSRRPFGGSEELLLGVENPEDFIKTYRLQDSFAGVGHIDNKKRSALDDDLPLQMDHELDGRAVQVFDFRKIKHHAVRDPAERRFDLLFENGEIVFGYLDKRDNPDERFFMQDLQHAAHDSGSPGLVVMLRLKGDLFNHTAMPGRKPEVAFPYSIVVNWCARGHSINSPLCR